MIAFSIDFSRLPQAAVSIKIPARPLTNQKDDAFSVFEIRIVFSVEKTVLGRHYLGATLEYQMT